MKKFVVAAVGLLALSVSSASAADLGPRMVTKAPPMYPVVYNWTGFYVGLNGGGGWARKAWDLQSATTLAFLPESSHTLSGGVVGGQIGYRWQLSPSWVVGLEAQGDWARLTGSGVSAIPGLVDNSQVNAFGLFTGQVGYAFNNWLLYTKGGAAVVGDKYWHNNLAGFTVDTTTETRWGGVVGAGIEYGFLPNWSVALEYDHLFMGTRTLGFTNVNGAIGNTDRIKQDVDLLTARVNYRFDWGGPVVARY
ncbi:MAG: porin family protein [Alphaproteobacteria bacterium]|nr:porin family protein [Alphaproteobacteria bacterium]